MPIRIIYDLLVSDQLQVRLEKKKYQTKTIELRPNINPRKI